MSMARILLSYFSDYGEAMYDAISSVLLKYGNDIFRFNINCKMVDITSWGGESKVNDNNLINEIKNFDPEVILNFNYSLPENLYECINKYCKICIIDADNPETFWNKKKHLKNNENYIYLGLQSYSKLMYEKYIGKNLEEWKNYIYFPPATIVNNEQLNQDKNISFIGSNFYPLTIPQGEDFYTESALKLYDEFKKDYFYPIERGKKLCSGVQSPEWLHEQVRAYYVGQERLKYMQSLTDLGFTFYGVRWWNRIAYYDFELAKCFDPTPKVTIKENQWVYNTSKISINISHPQAKTSFSWRVMDIMASNSCLLMEYKEDWHELFAKYMSKEVLDIVIYKDRYDMREKAIKLLSDDKLRKHCVRELNHAIAQNGRWEHRFSLLEKVLGIDILNKKTRRNIYIFIRQSDEKIDAIDIKKNKSCILYKLKLKKRAKLIAYTGGLFLAQIPGVDIFLRRKTREKLLHKIHKYWR